MEDLKKALEVLSQSIKQLEDAVEYSLQQKNKHTEKIETLQSAIQTTYDRIDKALAQLDENPEQTSVSKAEEEDAICLLSL